MSAEGFLARAGCEEHVPVASMSSSDWWRGPPPPCVAKSPPRLEPVLPPVCADSLAWLSCPSPGSSSLPALGGVDPKPPAAPDPTKVPELPLAEPVGRVMLQAWVSNGIVVSTVVIRWLWRSSRVFMVATNPRSWSNFTELVIASGSISTPNMDVNASAVSDTKLIWPQSLGVLKGDRKSRLDWEDERKGYGECSDECLSSWRAWVTTVTEETSLSEIISFDNNPITISILLYSGVLILPDKSQPLTY
jgi:hypothetical protein